jgi:hypothetical protein
MAKIKQEKWMTYAVLIQSAIAEMFEDGANNFIDKNDFDDEQNAKDFLHALANVAPTHLFNKLTNDDKNMLEFNHVANQLCFEYMTHNEAE